MSPVAVLIERALARLLPGWPDARLCVALSGGVDSAALLAACAELRAGPSTPGVRAIHVHHGLQPEADDWQVHCDALCRRLGVPLDVVRLALAPRRGESVEAEARAARYAALAGRLAPGEALLTAHHQDDQLETVLLQLFRGAGVAGLAAMPAAAPLGPGLHLRPLLGCGRAVIEAYVREAGLECVLDPMNAATRFDRSFLRLEITPRLRRRWPAVARSAARSARHLAEAQSLLDELAARDAGSVADGECLAVAPLRALSRPRQANLLRWWLRERGLRPLSSARLASVLDDLLPARPDADPLLRWAGGELRRYRGRLYALQPLPVLPRDWQQDIRPGGTVELPGGLGRVGLLRGAAPGLSDEAVSGSLLLRSRRGGDRLRPFGEAHSRTLAELCQAQGVPPWQRGRLPVLVADGRVIAIGERWLEAQAADPAGGWRLVPLG